MSLFLLKSRATGPGSRGSTKWYIDDHGQIVYGERPAVRGRASKSGDPADITVGEHVYETNYLGKGHYARAYRFGDHVYLFVKGDYMKEMIAHAHIDNPHVPQVEYVDEHWHRDDVVAVYRMPYYEPLSSKHRAAWAQYKELKRAFEEAERQIRAEVANRTGRHGYSVNVLADYGYEVNDRFAEIANVEPSLKDALRDLSSAAANYGSGVTFEWGIRNIGVNKEGGIVLRDVMFDAEKIRDERRAAARRHVNYY